MATVLTNDGDKDESETSRRKRTEGRVSDTKEARNSGGSLCEEDKEKREDVEMSFIEEKKKKSKDQEDWSLEVDQQSEHILRAGNQDWPYLKYDEGSQKVCARTLLSSEST